VSITVASRGKTYTLKAYSCRRDGCSFKASSERIRDVHEAGHGINPNDLDVAGNMKRLCTVCGKRRPIWRFETKKGKAKGKVCLYCRRS
jgi:hypothetical protein